MVNTLLQITSNRCFIIKIDGFTLRWAVFHLWFVCMFSFSQRCLTWLWAGVWWMTAGRWGCDWISPVSDSTCLMSAIRWVTRLCSSLFLPYRRVCAHHSESCELRVTRWHLWPCLRAWWYHANMLHNASGELSQRSSRSSCDRLWVKLSSA